MFFLIIVCRGLYQYVDFLEDIHQCKQNKAINENKRRKKKIDKELETNSNAQHKAVNLMAKLTLVTLVYVISSLLRGIYTVYLSVTFARTDASNTYQWKTEQEILGNVFCEAQAVINCLLLYYTCMFSVPQHGIIF